MLAAKRAFQELVANWLLCRLPLRSSRVLGASSYFPRESTFVLKELMEHSMTDVVIL